MVERKATVPSGKHEACPSCGNDTQYLIRAEQVQEDMCEIRAICICGHAPSTEGVEDIWGEVNQGTALCALKEWDRAIREAE